MPHQNTPSSPAADQNPGGERADEQSRAAHPEPRAYAAPDVADSTLAAPAAGEMATFSDEGDALNLDDMQMGANHTRRPIATEAKHGQGPKTLHANRDRVKSGSPDRGTS